MAESSSEELRAMLRNVEFRGLNTPMRPDGRMASIEGFKESGVPLEELASLISSLDIDIGTPLKHNSSTASRLAESINPEMMNNTDGNRNVTNKEVS